MDLSKLLQICHLWGTASQGQLFTVHGRIGSLALVHRQMITTMIAGILASCLAGLAPIHDTTLPPYFESRDTRGRPFVMLAQQRSPGDWASTGLHGPGEREISKDLLSLVVRAKPFYWDESSIPGPHAAGPLPMTPAAAGEDYVRALFLGTGPW